MTAESDPKVNGVEKEIAGLKASHETRTKKYYDELAEAWDTIKGFTLNPNNWSKGKPYDG